MYKITIFILIVLCCTKYKAEAKSPLKGNIEFSWLQDTLCLSLSLENSTNINYYIPISAWDVDGDFNWIEFKGFQPYPYFVNQLIFTPGNDSALAVENGGDSFYYFGNERFPKFLLIKPRNTIKIKLKFLDLSIMATSKLNYYFAINTPYISSQKFNLLKKILKISNEDLIINETSISLYLAWFKMKRGIRKNMFWEVGDLKYISLVKQYSDSSVKYFSNFTKEQFTDSSHNYYKDFHNKYKKELYTYYSQRIVSKSEADRIIDKIRINFIRTKKQLKHKR